MLLSLYLLVLFAVLVIGVKVAKKGEYHEDFLSLGVTKGLLGFAAIGIMLHHLVQLVSNYGAVSYGPIDVFNNVGVIFTGMFFFFSGYGLLSSIKSKPDYLKTFFRKRFPTVLIPFYIANTIFVVYCLIDGWGFSVGQTIIALTGLVLTNTHLWFIVEIIVLYIAFYIIFRFVKKENAAFWCMGAFVVLLITISLLLGHDYTSFSGGAWFKGEWWYNSTFLFFIGMAVAKCKEKLIPAVKKHYAIFLVAGFIIFILLFMANSFMLNNFGYYCEGENYPGYLEKLLTLLVQLPMAITGILTFLMLTMKCQFKNPVLVFLGKISMELYMIHNLFIFTLPRFINDPVLLIACIYLGSIIFATILHYLDSAILKKIKK